MRTIERSGIFKKDFRRIQKQPRHTKDLAAILSNVLSLLAADASLPPALNDHSLQGEWAGYRECHLKPDLLLIYRKTDDNALRLARLGSHSELFR